MAMKQAMVAMIVREPMSHVYQQLHFGKVGVDFEIEPFPVSNCFGI